MIIKRMLYELSSLLILFLVFLSLLLIRLNLWQKALFPDTNERNHKYLRLVAVNMPEKKVENDKLGFIFREYVQSGTIILNFKYINVYWPKEKPVYKVIKFVFMLIPVCLILNCSSSISVSSHSGSLANVSVKMLNELKKPLQIKVFFTDNIKKPYNEIKPAISNILKQYALADKNGYFYYEFIDVGTSEDFGSEEISKNRTLADDYNISSVGFEILDLDDSSFVLAYMGVSIFYGDLIESITPIQTTIGLEYKITTTIQKMLNKLGTLSNINNNIQVKLYHSSAITELFPNASAVPGIVAKVTEVVKKLNMNKVDYTLIDLTRETDKIAEAKSLSAYGFSNKTAQYFSDIIITHSGRYEKVKVIELVQSLYGGYSLSISDEKTLILQINQAINRLLDSKMRIGYLVNGSTLPLTASETDSYASQEQGITNFKEIIEDEYSIFKINLDERPGDLFRIRCLIIGGPKAAFTDYQLFQIDQFLMQGNALAVFYDGINCIAPEQNSQFTNSYQYRYLQNQTGFEALLEHYGVTITPSYVYDESGYKQTGHMGSNILYPVPVIQNNMLNNKIDYIKNIQGIILYAVSPLSIDKIKLKKNNITVDILFSSSDRSWTQKELPDSQNKAIMKPPADESMKTSYPLACVLEGRFRSYYADKPIPVKTSGASTGNTDGCIAEDEILTGCREPGKIFVIGSSFVLDNQIFNSNMSQNMILYLNIIEYLMGRGEYAYLRTK